MSKVVVFRTGNEEYALPLQCVVSIEKIEEVTPIPQMPGYVKGIIEIRKEVIPIIDIEHIFFNRFIKTDDRARLVIIQSEQLTLGILVNEAKEITEIPPEQIKQVGLIATTDYITGVVSLEGRLVTLIDPEIFIRSLDNIKQLQDYMESHR